MTVRFLLGFVLVGCTYSDARMLPIAKGGPQTSSAPEQTQTSTNAPLTASVAPEGRGHFGDRRISDRVRGAIIKDPALNQLALYRVRIETREGKVIVAGIVTTAEQEKALLERVRSVEGVQGVDDQLEVLPAF